MNHLEGSSKKINRHSWIYPSIAEGYWIIALDTKIEDLPENIIRKVTEARVLENVDNSPSVHLRVALFKVFGNVTQTFDRNGENKNLKSYTTSICGNIIIKITMFNSFELFLTVGRKARISL